jgi:hypothetical protein
VDDFIAGIMEEARRPSGRGASVIEGPRVSRGAVAGGGGVEVIANQVRDLRKMVVSSRDEDFIRQREALVDGFARLLPMREKKGATMVRATLSGFKPLVETFNLSIRPFTTQNLHDVSVVEFGQMMGRATTKDQQTQFITCMDLLIQEAIINQISINDAIVKSMSQLIWNNSLPRFAFGLVGTYISIILARDSLLLFANTILTTISIGHLTLDQLTLYCAYVYNESTSENLINLLVYLGAGSTDAAKEYLKTLANFVDVQVRYIVMVIYLLGLQTFSGQRQISPNIQRLLDAMADRGARPAAGANGAHRPIPNLPAEAAANLQGGLGAAVPAAAAAAAAAAPGQGVGGPIVWDGNAFTFVKEGITNLFMRGFNFTSGAVTNIFKLYAARGPSGQGSFVHFNNALLALSNTGGRAIQARAGFVNQNPDEETNKLIAALMEIRINRETTPRQLEDALGLFSERISQNMLTILREGVRGDRVAVTQRGWSFLDQARFDLLHAVFIQGAQGGGGGVNMERFRSFCQRMPLFASGLTTERVAARIGRSLEIPDSQEVGAPGADSMARMDAEILTADTETTRLLNGVRSRLQRFGENYMDAAGSVAVLAGARGGPSADPIQVLQRMNEGNRLRQYQQTIQNAIDVYLEEEHRAERLNQEQRSLIGEDLNRRVNALNMAGIHEYIIGQEPRSGVPQTWSGSLGQFFSAPIPQRLQSVRDIVKNAIIRGAGRLTATLYDTVVNSGVASAALARGFINIIRNGVFAPAHDVARVQPGEAPLQEEALRPAQAPAALLQNIDNALDAVVPAPVGEVEVDQIDDAMRDFHGDGYGIGNRGNRDNRDNRGNRGGRSQSFKRKISKRTRRKGRQFMKTKSRRYMRHRRQTIRRKN